MIELKKNQLNFDFSHVHPRAKCSIEFQRTLRIPDDNRDYPLPPGLGRFPVQHVDDYKDTLPGPWIEHGGVLIPMYQAEALWINFFGHYPCAVKIAAGKVNAVSGDLWTNELSDTPQDYVVIPDQPWLDGFNVAEGLIRQFVAMPLGEGYSAEEQVTGAAEHGGLQIIVYPMKQEVYKARFEQPQTVRSLCSMADMKFSLVHDMGLAPGGMMRQKIHADEYGLDAWDLDNGLRCFVHLANSELYQQITGQQPPQKPINAQDYSKAGLPWFEHYSDKPALAGAKPLTDLTGVAATHLLKGQGNLPGNESVKPTTVKIPGQPKRVRDGVF